MKSDRRQMQVDAVAEHREEAPAEGEMPSSSRLERRCPGHASTQQEGARKRRRTFVGVEYDHIIAIDKNDRVVYNSADYATENEAVSALRACFSAIVADAIRRESRH